ncbi:Bromodomain-containing protein, partial [Martensiomyces pterosporus]
MMASDGHDPSNLPVGIDVSSPERIASAALGDTKRPVEDASTSMSTEQNTAAAADTEAARPDPQAESEKQQNGASTKTNGHPAPAESTSIDEDNQPAAKRMRKMSSRLEDYQAPKELETLFTSPQAERESAPATAGQTVTEHAPDRYPEASVPAQPRPESIMTKEQHKYCTAIVRALKKHRDAGPFLNPVDIVALNIPDYPDIVKYPMDLGTVEKKLKARQYADTQTFTDDLRLMFNNCYMYNGRESVVGNMASNLETMFESQLKKMPTGIDTALAEHNRRTSEASARRSSSVSRPKREAHPPPSRDVPGSSRKKSRSADPQMKFCLGIVKDFLKKSNFNIAYPFLEPVDPVAMNCRDYFDVIKEPMDLSTIKKQLERGAYPGPLEFESDIRLMFRNCYSYNPPGHPVHEAGRALEARFDTKWADLPAPRTSQSPDEFDKHVYGAEDEVDVDARSQASHADEIRDLEMKVQSMARQLEELKRGETAGRRRPSHATRDEFGAAAGDAAHGAPASSGRGRGRRRRGSIESLELTLEQKRALSGRIEELGPNRLRVSLMIIKSAYPDLNEEEDEIELDIDSLDHFTLRKLY